MEYCDECSSVMSPKKEGGKKYLICRKCGAKKRASSEDFTVSKKHKKEGDDIVVMDEKSMSDADALPVAEKSCPECGHDKAGWWTQQTRSGDEAPTRFYRCKKCGHRWREYS